MPVEIREAAVTSHPIALPTTGTQPIKASVFAEQDVEGLKVRAMDKAKVGDSGARQAELMQLTWGKHGRWWIFFGLGFCMLA